MNKTERIFKIEQLIAARKLVSFQTLLDELEVSRATLKRDLEYLRSRMKTPIVYDREANGYRLVCYRENWYLDAWCHLRQDIRSFAVDGIRQAKILDQPAKEIADSELDEGRTTVYDTLGR